MRLILFIFLNFIFVSVAEANNSLFKIKIQPNAKTSSLEIKFFSTNKKNFQTNVFIIDSEGNKVRSFKCEIIKGFNAVCLQDALNLKEGIYAVELNVKKKTSSAKFVLFK